MTFLSHHPSLHFFLFLFFRYVFAVRYVFFLGAFSTLLRPFRLGDYFGSYPDMSLPQRRSKVLGWNACQTWIAAPQGVPSASTFSNPGTGGSSRQFFFLGGGQLGAGSQPRVPPKLRTSRTNPLFFGMDPNSLSIKKLFGRFGEAQKT